MIFTPFYSPPLICLWKNSRSLDSEVRWTRWTVIKSFRVWSFVNKRTLIWVQTFLIGNKYECDHLNVPFDGKGYRFSVVFSDIWTILFTSLQSYLVPSITKFAFISEPRFDHRYFYPSHFHDFCNFAEHLFKLLFSKCSFVFLQILLPSETNTFCTHISTYSQ